MSGGRSATPHTGVLAPNDSDLAVVFQDRCSDLSDIRTTLMAQCLGKFCQSNVLPLHLVCPAAPMSDEDLGCAFEKPFGELAGTGQHAHAVGQPDQGRAFAFDRQAAWENPRQCGKRAGGTRRFSSHGSEEYAPQVQRSEKPSFSGPASVRRGRTEEPSPLLDSLKKVAVSRSIA